MLDKGVILYRLYELFATCWPSYSDGSVRLRGPINYFVSQFCDTGITNPT